VLHNFFFVSFRHVFVLLDVVYGVVDVCVYLVYVDFLVGFIVVLCLGMLSLCMKLYISVYGIAILKICPKKDILYMWRTEKLFYTNTGMNKKC
jgi:hypothetical protein